MEAFKCLLLVDNENVECCCASRRQTSVYGRVKGERGRVRDRETDRQRQTETEKERFEFG
jgi:hypothetical protein